jgi:hypothetical protein
MDSLLQFLFKYKWSVFSRGDLRFAARPAWIVIILVVLTLGALIYFIYIKPGYRITQGRQVALISMRIALLGLIALLLMRPVLVVSSVIPQSTGVAIVADSSRSMELNDENNSSRLDAMKTTLDGPFRKALDARFKVRLHKFSDSVEGVQSTTELSASGPATDIARALTEGSKDSAGIPLSAIVLMSDGGANTTADLTAALRDLRTANIPVYAVGYGSTKAFKDAEIVRVGAPKRVLVGSAVNAEVLLKVSGFGDSGQTKAIVAISEDGKAIKTENVDIRSAEAQTVNIEFTPAAAGVHRYTFEIKPLEGELTLENNAQESLIEITNNHPRVLYIEGEPRWEYGKMRAALDATKRIWKCLSTSISGRKFYRQGVESGQNWTRVSTHGRGAVRLRRLLSWKYGGEFLHIRSLKMIEQFACQARSRDFALGGSRAFDAGSTAILLIAAMLPLDLDDRIEEPEIPAVSNFKAELTARGRMHAVTRLNEDRI